MSIYKRFAIILTLAIWPLSNTQALFKHGEETTLPGETLSTAKQIMACTLIKASFKGAMKKIFKKDTDKSVEGYCHNNVGEPLHFSAGTENIDKIKQHAGRDVLIYMSSNKKLENAKTEMVMLDIKATGDGSYRTEKLCGPETGKHLFHGESMWSRGFRLAHAYYAKHDPKGWQLILQEGKQGTAIWGDKPHVSLSRFCNADIDTIMHFNEPLLYFYAQPEEDGIYFIESVHRISVTPPPAAPPQ